MRAVVLTGAGEKAFVAGADIAEMHGYTPVQAQGFSRTGQRLMSSIERLGKPVIARIQGFALGGGMELAMACHLRVASEKAKVRPAGNQPRPDPRLRRHPAPAAAGRPRRARWNCA